MKQYLIGLLKNVVTAGVVTLAIVGTAVYALGFPDGIPVGENEGGVFGTMMKKILVNEDLSDPANTGMVKDSDRVDGLSAADLGGGSQIFPVHYTSLGSISCIAGYTKAWDGNVISMNNAGPTMGTIGYISGGGTNALFCLGGERGNFSSSDGQTSQAHNEYRWLEMYPRNSGAPYKTAKCAVCIRN